MRVGSKLQEMGWDLANGENKIVIFKLEILSVVSTVSKVVLNYALQCDNAFLSCRKIR
jgi:hypothetical protein